MPGYRELFGEPEKNYDELVKEVPSEVIISLLVMLNNELNAPLADEENQLRLRNLLSRNFSKQQLYYLNQSFQNYKNKPENSYKDFIFGRRFLLEMILKELNKYRNFKITDTTGDDEYNILRAYFLTIDEIHETQKKLLEEALIDRDDPLINYKVLWTPNINQYEFNDRIDLGYEYLRLLSFLKYCLDHYRPYLIEYLQLFNFTSLNDLFSSIHQVSSSIRNFHKDNVFKKSSFISPSHGTHTSHLDAQTINSRIGKTKLEIDDLRKFPLFLSERKAYMYIDGPLFNRRAYKGPFFELYYNTSLSKKINFTAYSSEVSLEVLEKKVFRSIVLSLNIPKNGVRHFDDQSDSVPDCYIRTKNDIFLFEFKGYIFPNSLSSNPNFKNIKNYIDKRFIENENGKKKGIGQIINQLSILMRKGFSFDANSIASTKKKITVYPLLIHTEFHFSMPGINEYLNEIFISKLPDELKNHFNIKPVILMNLENLFDFAFRTSKFSEFQTLINRYYRIIENRKSLYKKDPSINTNMRAHSSFDEVYSSIFVSELKKQRFGEQPIDKFMSLIDITQQELDENLI